MTQALASVILFVVLLALLPAAVRWLQRRRGALGEAATGMRLLSAVAVGPQQKVVTVEVGPEGGRTWLVLGVTAQQISCLHSQPAPPVPMAPVAATPVAAAAPARSAGFAALLAGRVQAGRTAAPGAANDGAARSQG